MNISHLYRIENTKSRTSFTKETRENIKKSVIGRKHSEETKLKISQSNKLTKKGKLNG